MKPTCFEQTSPAAKAQAFGRQEAVGNKCVEMWVEIEIFAEGVNGHHHAGNAVGQLQSGALLLQLQQNHHRDLLHLQHPFLAVSLVVATELGGITGGAHVQNL